MSDSPEDHDTPAKLTRRHFIGSTAGVGLTSLVTAAEAAPAVSPQSVPDGVVPPRSQDALQRDVGDVRPPAIERAVTRPGSDLMVQVLKDLGVEFIALNPASSFEGLQESLINYGEPPNNMPEIISALHEESSVDMAHGYAKCEGKPMAAMMHGTIGVQHASMAIYQAYHSRVPIVILVGRDDKFFLQQQTADDIAGITRSFTKWDAQPETLEECLDAIQAAYNEAITPPCGPTVVVIDTELQKQEAGDMLLPRYEAPIFPVISETQAANIGRRLVAARNPRISVGRMRTPAGSAAAVQLAELVGTSVETQARVGPMSFPQRHPLCGPGDDTDYDYELGLETVGAQQSIIGPQLRSLKHRDETNIGFGNVRGKGDARDNMIEADAEASIPLIIAAVEKLQTSRVQQSVQARGERHRHANDAAHLTALRDALDSRRNGWNGSPVATARIYAELRPLLENEDWCLASPTVFSSRHNAAIWEHNRPYSYLGSYDAGALGYGIGASVGAGLSARGKNRIVINIQGDGDLNYTPGSLWTAAHHRLPVLTIMHNNRAWHQEVMYMHYMAGVRGRGTDRAHIGTTLRDPFINYKKMAETYGMEGEGPISDPQQLSAALQRGIDVVKSGRPYLIDVLTQPR